MVSLRSKEGKKEYQEYLKTHVVSDPCPLCIKVPREKFLHWSVVENSFPYDQIAETHHMLVSVRHVVEQELNESELDELKSIKATFVASNYDWIIEATPKNKSIPTHFHLHLIVAKKIVHAHFSFL